jgi:hypothetical protein
MYRIVLEKGRDSVILYADSKEETIRIAGAALLRHETVHLSYEDPHHLAVKSPEELRGPKCQYDAIATE